MLTDNVSITLHDAGPIRTVDRNHLYFAFGSGRLAYDCATCRAQCCRGFGYQLQPEELQHHLRYFPSVRFFIENKRGDEGASLVKNCPPGCFFLSSTGMCGVQQEFGYEHKPETCRLFPFNFFRRVGDVLFVGPHTHLCPLTVSMGEPSSAHSDHGALFLEMASKGIRHKVKQAIPTCGDPGTALTLEREIRDLSERFLVRPFAAFVSAQLAATRHTLGPAAGGVGTAAAVDEYVQKVCSVLGARPSESHLSDPSVMALAAGATPVLRFRLLFQTEGEEAIPRIDPGRVPYFLAALHVLLAFAHETGMRSLTFQTVNRIFDQSFDLLLMLAHLDVRMEWKPSARIPLPLDGAEEFQRPYVRIARGLLPRNSRRLTFGDLLLENLPFEAIRRVEFLHTLATQLRNKLAPAQGSPVPGRPSVRSVAQRWAFAWLDEDLLASVGRRATA